ncbi:MAG: CDP-alcohol phosphatidyltransferase family protein [Spirochaetia bacterium]|nr:CDP-alcohol phosphatidyltransferase family protein [Spirochaetia bacterium]
MIIKAWIPNAMSLSNLALGFLSILLCGHAAAPLKYPVENIYFISSLLILSAVFVDGFDGMVARWLHVESPIGKQLDSLADLTTFGIAPGVLIYTMFLHDIQTSVNFFELPLISVIIASIYPISAAFRLARFNVDSRPESFVGLPSPIAGATLALIGIVYKVYPLPALPVIILYLILAILMSSNIRYSKPQIQFKQHFTIFRLIFLFTALFSAMYYFSWYLTILMCLLFYISSGILVLFLHVLQKAKFVFGKLQPVRAEGKLKNLNNKRNKENY